MSEQVPRYRLALALVAMSVGAIAAPSLAPPAFAQTAHTQKRHTTDKRRGAAEQSKRRATSTCHRMVPRSVTYYLSCAPFGLHWGATWERVRTVLGNPHIAQDGMMVHMSYRGTEYVITGFGGHGRLGSVTIQGIGHAVTGRIRTGMHMRTVHRLLRGSRLLPIEGVNQQVVYEAGKLRIRFACREKWQFACREVKIANY